MYITWKKGCCNASSAAGLFEGSHEHSRYGQPRRKVSDIISRCYSLNSNVVNKFDCKNHKGSMLYQQYPPKSSQ